MLHSSPIVRVEMVDNIVDKILQSCDLILVSQINAIIVKLEMVSIFDFLIT